MIPNPYNMDCPSRDLLDRITRRWTVLIVGALEEGPLRFSELERHVEGISQKMLSQSLRQLSQDGLVRRNAFPVIPPRVEYELTRLGRDLSRKLDILDNWVRSNLGDVQRARHEFERSRA